MAQPAERAVVIFARLPRPGLVKTRLAAGVGAEGAALLYEALAERVILELSSLPGVAVYLFYSRGEDAAEVAAWLAPLGVAGVTLQQQLEDADLGARMAHALGAALAAGHRRVAVVGTDVPDLTGAIVAQALQALEEHQVVLGPAEDGGYYLLALRTLPPGLLAGIQWSTPTVLAATAAAAERCGLSVAPPGSLPTLPDIDTADDLRRWCRHALEKRQQQQQQGEQQQQSSSSTLLDVALRVSGMAADGS